MTIRVAVIEVSGDITTPYFAVVRGAPPPISVHDLARAVRLIDQAYALAG